MNTLEKMTKKPFSLSPSSIKTFVWSKAKRAWKYILWVKDSDDNQDNLRIGKLFEERLFTWIDNWDVVKWVEITNSEKFHKDYETLKHNSKWMHFVKWETQVEVKWELFGYPVRWYIDNLVGWVIEDVKTAHYLSKPWDDSVKNMWSGMSYNEEYLLQLRIYSRLLWQEKTHILEVSKHDYKDKRHAHQIIEYTFTKELDKKMEDKYKPIIEEMAELHKQFNLT